MRRIRELLYRDGFTISGARNRLDEYNILKRETADMEERGKATVSQIRQELQGLLALLRS